MAQQCSVQIQCIACFDDKTISDQWRSADNLAPIRDVSESTISRFQMAYTPNDHSTNDEQLVVLRHKCPFYTFIESKLVKHGIEVWVAGLAKDFYALHHASIHLQD